MLAGTQWADPVRVSVIPDVWRSELAWAGEHYGVIWHEGGCVFMRTLGRDGVPIGEPTAPLDCSRTYYWSDLSWTGEEFGVGAVLYSEVRFARADSAGQWIQESSPVSDEASRPGPMALAWAGTDYLAVWVDTRSGYSHPTFAALGCYCVDYDGDGVTACFPDNCPGALNQSQSDSDQDGVGDACDDCVLVANSDQVDSDFDERGDACDCAPSYPSTWTPPSEVTGVMFMDRFRLEWDSEAAEVGGAIQYDILRGDMAVWGAGAHEGESCIGWNTNDPPTT